MEFEEFVLAASTADLGVVPAVRDAADAVEFRMDMARRPLEALDAYDGDLPVIATNRTTEEGGQAPPGAQRIDALCEAARYPRVGAVDVELASVRSGDAGAVLAAPEGVATVVSVHDFEGTPARDRMYELLSAACEHGDVGKLAVTAGGPTDVLDLLSVTHELAAEGEAVATMAMGEAGRHSRAMAPLYGSRIGYAPADAADATAPGQYDLETLADLVRRLSGER